VLTISYCWPMWVILREAPTVDWTAILIHLHWRKARLAIFRYYLKLYLKCCSTLVSPGFVLALPNFTSITCFSLKIKCPRSPPLWFDQAHPLIIDLVIQTKTSRVTKFSGKLAFRQVQLYSLCTAPQRTTASKSFLDLVLSTPFVCMDFFSNLLL